MVNDNPTISFTLKTHFVILLLSLAVACVLIALSLETEGNSSVGSFCAAQYGNSWVGTMRVWWLSVRFGAVVLLLFLPLVSFVIQMVVEKIAQKECVHLFILSLFAQAIAWFWGTFSVYYPLVRTPGSHIPEEAIPFSAILLVGIVFAYAIVALVSAKNGFQTAGKTRERKKVV